VRSIAIGWLLAAAVVFAVTSLVSAQEPAAKAPARQVDELNPNQDPISAGVMPRLILGRRQTSPDLITTRAAGIRLALIPAGTFWMGLPDEDADDDQKPQHEVRISAFYLGLTEVTRGQFRGFVHETGYKTDAEKDGKGGSGWSEEKKNFEQAPNYAWLNPGFEQTDEHPVVNVTWNDAVAFCEWLTRVEGQTYRLPTEAEWEYACRARTTTKYFSGDDPESLATVANIADGTAKTKFPDWNWAIAARDGFVYTAPSAQFRPNAFGLYDMHGNVWEWCRDGYDAEYYKRSPKEDPPGPSQAELRVFRGGGWFCHPHSGYSAGRGRSKPGYRCADVGFRVARVQSSR
jgi:formylglycine-generating enzyme required for sulfatase activity